MLPLSMLQPVPPRIRDECQCKAKMSRKLWGERSPRGSWRIILQRRNERRGVSKKCV